VHYVRRGEGDPERFHVAARKKRAIGGGKVTERTGWKVFGAVAGILLLAGLVLVPVPAMAWMGRYPLLAETLENSAHPVVFAALAALAWRAWRRPGLALLLAALLGAGTEGIQFFAHRDASWADFANDLLGAGFALSVLAWRRPALAALCAVLAAAPLAHTLAAYAWRATQWPVVWQADAWLDAPFAHENGPPYPGFALEEPGPDWRGFRALELDVVNEADAPVTVTLRVHDGAHQNRYEDRYNEAFVLAARSSQRIEVLLGRILLAPRGRQMDLSDIRGVILFRQATDTGHHVSVEAVRLVR
jgi:hypothetical protein